MALSPFAGLSEFSHAPGAIASAFVPTDIPGCQLWLPAYSITGLSNDDPIVLFDDQSGNGRDATCSLATYQTNVLNGKPVVRLASGGKVTIAAQELALSWGITDQSAVYAVVKLVFASQIRLFEWGPNSGDLIGLWHQFSDGNDYFDHGNISVDGRISGSVSSVAGTWEIINTLKTSTTGTVNQNGSSVLTGGMTGALTVVSPADFTIGTVSSGLDLAEFIVYSAPPTTLQKAQLASYFSTEYGL